MISTTTNDIQILDKVLIKDSWFMVRDIISIGNSITDVVIDFDNKEIAFSVAQVKSVLSYQG